MLDKTILVFYINVGNLDHGDVPKYIDNMKQKLTLKSEKDNDSMIRYFIPIREGDSRIECLNLPQIIISEKVHKNILSKFNKVNNNLERISSCLNAEVERRNIILEKM